MAVTDDGYGEPPSSANAAHGDVAEDPFAEDIGLFQSFMASAFDAISGQVITTSVDPLDEYLDRSLGSGDDLLECATAGLGIQTPSVMEDSEAEGPAWPSAEDDMPTDAQVPPKRAVPPAPPMPKLDEVCGGAEESSPARSKQADASSSQRRIEESLAPGGGTYPLIAAAATKTAPTGEAQASVRAQARERARARAKAREEKPAAAATATGPSNLHFRPCEKSRDSGPQPPDCPPPLKRPRTLVPVKSEALDDDWPARHALVGDRDSDACVTTRSGGQPRPGGTSSGYTLGTAAETDEAHEEEPRQREPPSAIFLGVGAPPVSRKQRLLERLKLKKGECNASKSSKLDTREVPLGKHLVWDPAHGDYVQEDLPEDLQELVFMGMTKAPTMNGGFGNTKIELSSVKTELSDRRRTGYMEKNGSPGRCAGVAVKRSCSPGRDEATAEEIQDTLQQAEDVVLEAKMFSSAGKHKDAYSKYCEGIEILVNAVSDVPGGEQSAAGLMLRDRLNKFLTQAERLQVITTIESRLEGPAEDEQGPHDAMLVEKLDVQAQCSDDMCRESHALAEWGLRDQSDLKAQQGTQTFLVTVRRLAVEGYDLSSLDRAVRICLSSKSYLSSAFLRQGFDQDAFRELITRAWNGEPAPAVMSTAGLKTLVHPKKVVPSKCPVKELDNQGKPYVLKSILSSTGSSRHPMSQMPVAQPVKGSVNASGVCSSQVWYEGARAEPPSHEWCENGCAALSSQVQSWGASEDPQNRETSEGAAVPCSQAPPLNERLGFITSQHFPNVSTETSSWMEYPRNACQVQPRDLVRPSQTRQNAYEDPQSGWLTPSQTPPPPPQEPFNVWAQQYPLAERASRWSGW